MYDQFYHLSGRPFQLTPDPGFYFESATHRKALSYLGYGLAQGEGFIVITGEVGAGKTTLAGHLLASIDRERLSAATVIASQVDGNELVALVANAFGVSSEAARLGGGKSGALTAIEAFLQQEARAGRRCLLIVDEAQTLGVDALEQLRLLSNFQLGAHPLLQIFLLGQPEFRTLLQTSPNLEQFRQRIIATHHLEAMEPGEIGPYIEHRLTRVGWHRHPLFDQAVYEGLARASLGIPRRVNQLVTRLLLLGAMEQADRIVPAMLEDVLSDLAGDGAFSQPDAAAHASGSVDIAAEVATAVEKALAGRDHQIAELQQVLVDLTAMRAREAESVPPAIEPGLDLEPILAALVDLTRRTESLEARSVDQNEAIRHVLMMLIDWIEQENANAIAA